MATDRQYLKVQQEGSLNTTGAVNAHVEVGRAHCRARDIQKTGTENAATTVAETVLVNIQRKSQFGNSSNGTITYNTGTNVASDATDYTTITVKKRDGAGGAAVTLASWNTHPSAQGAITAWIPASLSVVANADATVAAGSVLTFAVAKAGAGKLLDVGVFSIDPEEV